jgi:hypothetical protein
MPESFKTVIGDVEYTVELMFTSQAGEVFKTSQSIIASFFAPNIEFKLGQTDAWIMESIASYLTYYNQSVDLFEISKKLLWNVDMVYIGGGKAGSGHLNFHPSTPEKINPDPFCYDNFFAGKLDQLFELLLFALGVNFPGFFGKVSSVIEMLKMMNSEREETLQSDGESKES